MSTFDFAKQVEAWSKPPVGGCNLSTKQVAQSSRRWYVDNVPILYQDQYRQPSSWEDRYRKFLRLDSTYNQSVMDFGCGFGMDALSYAQQGNRVILADIVPYNLIVATNTLLSQGFTPKAVTLVLGEAPFFDCGLLNVFHASGVLHHTPYARQILEQVVKVLHPGGEIRLMLYTDHLWRQATRTEPGLIEQDVRHHPMFDHYVRFCDAVGGYSDWYNREKLEYRFGDFLEITFFDYLRQDQGYCVCHLKPKK